MEARWNDRSLSVDDDYMNLVINNHGLIWTPNEIARNASNIVEMILAMLMANDRVRLKLEYDGNESLHRCPHRTLSHYYVLPHSYYSHTDACVYFRAGFSHRCILSLSLSLPQFLCVGNVFFNSLMCWRVGGRLPPAQYMFQTKRQDQTRNRNRDIPVDSTRRHGECK